MISVWQFDNKQHNVGMFTCDADGARNKFRFRVAFTI